MKTMMNNQSNINVIQFKQIGDEIISKMDSFYCQRMNILQTNVSKRKRKKEIGEW